MAPGVVLVLIGLTGFTFAGNSQFRDLYSDSWVAADALQRTLPGYDECGPPREGKFTGIFYFLWLGSHGTRGPYDITKLLADNPENPQYGPQGAFHHWGESELGYYLSDSEYVIRKHVQMLTNADIDTLIFDVTNGYTYTENYMKLCEILIDIRKSGSPTPRICFLTHSGSANVITRLYNEFYAKNLHSELWFHWKGKPLILGGAKGLDQKIAKFFTIRDCWAWTSGKDTWQWLENYPQKYAWHESADKPEEVSVCAAQHPTSNIGRSHFDGKQPPYDKYILTQTMDQGIYFQQQWQGALDIDPEFIFITGWNEWVAQRFITNSGQKFLGKSLPNGGTFFVDQYSQEYSRDIEPMKGGCTDNYYYQMIANIRRYKGIRKPHSAGPTKTISIDGKFSDWNDVTPEYRDAIGDTIHRKENGWGNAGEYINTTGRNDFVTMKIACDKDNIYFYAKTKEPITPRDDSNWMMLYINADCDHKTGWNGYDFLVNKSTMGTNATTLMKWDNTAWKPTGRLGYRVKGNEMEIRIPREKIDLKTKVAFNFHWADNIQNTDDIIQFSISGDSAPDRRFNYHYQR